MRKLMKARDRTQSAFIVFECLETAIKHEARVFEIASQSCIINQEQGQNSQWFWHRTRNINLLFLLFFFSNHSPLLWNILGVSHVLEDNLCLKRNTYTSFDLTSIILNEIWRCLVVGKPKQPKKRLIWFKTGYPCPLRTKKSNGLMEYSKSGKGGVW